MKVIILCSNLEAGGAQRAAIRLGKELNERNITTGNWFFHKKQDFFHDLPNINTILDYQINNIFDYIKLIYRLQNQLKESKPDAIISFLHYSNIIGLTVAYFCGIKIRIASHRNICTNDMSIIIRFIDAVCARWNIYTSITAVSESTKKSFKYYSKKDYNRIKVIHNGVNFIKTSLSKEECRKQLGIPKSKITIGNIGRLSKQKNQQLLIHTIARVPDSILVIVGNGELKEEFEQLAKKLNVDTKVILLGELSESEIVIFFKAIDIFAMPSLYEGLSNALIEALNAGLPIISSDVESQKDVLIRSSDKLEAGMLIPIDNQSEWVNAVLKLKDNSNLKKDYGEKSIQRGKDFSIENMVNGFIECLNLNHK